MRSCIDAAGNHFNIYCDGLSFQHLATVLISVFTLCYGSGLLFRGPPCISSTIHFKGYLLVILSYSLVSERHKRDFDVLLTVHLSIILVVNQPVHRTATYRCDDTRCCIIQFLPPDDEHIVLETCRGI